MVWSLASTTTVRRGWIRAGLFSDFVATSTSLRALCPTAPRTPLSINLKENQWKKRSLLWNVKRSIVLAGLILDTNENFALRLARPWNAGLIVMLVKRAHTWTPLYVTSCRKLLLWGSWTIPSPVLRSWVGTGATPVLVATSAGFRTIPCAPSSPVTVNYRSKKKTLKMKTQDSKHYLFLSCPYTASAK